jgi:hypothetical protein
MKIINVMNNCPKFDNCNSAFCPAEMSGLHLRDEPICGYFRMIAKDKAKEVPIEILVAILVNQMEFLSNDYPGYMSQYRKLINTPKTPLDSLQSGSTSYKRTHQGQCKGCPHNPI